MFKYWAMALACGLLLPVAASASTGFTASGTIDSLDTGKTLENGKVYVVDDQGAIITASYTENALSVADGATVVIYIPKGRRLKATGGDASGTTGAGAGIKVPATSTLTISSVEVDGGKITLGIAGGNTATLPMTEANSELVSPTVVDNGDGTCTLVLPDDGGECRFFRLEI